MMHYNDVVVPVPRYCSYMLVLLQGERSEVAHSDKKGFTYYHSALHFSLPPLGRASMMNSMLLSNQLEVVEHVKYQVLEDGIVDIGVTIQRSATALLYRAVTVQASNFKFGAVPVTRVCGVSCHQ